MVWVVASEGRARYLSYDDNDNKIIVTSHSESVAFDSIDEANEEADGVEGMFVQLR